MYHIKLIRAYYHPTDFNKKPETSDEAPSWTEEEVIPCKSYHVFRSDDGVSLALWGYPGQGDAEFGTYEAKYAFVPEGEPGLVRAYVMNDDFKTIDHIFQQISGGIR